jgi:16S rRNA (cytosine967-C5)-methyltransferase
VSVFFRRHRELGPRERHTLAETAYRVLRDKPLFDHLARGGPGAFERRLAMLAWVGDEAYVQRALSAEEAAWRGARLAVDRAALPAATRHGLPAWLVAPLTAAIGAEGFDALASALREPAPLDLRVNTLKAGRDDARAALAAAGIEAEPTPHSPIGLRIAGRPALAATAAFRDGLVEVQDEGSQLLAALVDARRGEMVVDFCAGAGGKTLALGAAMRGTGRLYAFDTSAHRLAALKPRLVRSGLQNVHTAAVSGGRDERVKRLAGKIHRVLVDAPCSGLGTLRRNPDLKWRQTPDTVRALHAQQCEILAAAARLVKPGGRLVYGTCSLLEEENEAVVQAFEAAAGADWIAVPAAEALAAARVERAEGLANGRFFRAWPHRHGTDGFFAACWLRR